MLLQYFGGQTKSIMIFLEGAYGAEMVLQRTSFLALEHRSERARGKGERNGCAKSLSSSHFLRGSRQLSTLERAIFRSFAGPTCLVTLI